MTRAWQPSLATWIVAEALLGLLVACGPAKSSAGPPPSSNSAEAKFAADFGDAFCKGLETCCATDGFTFNGPGCQQGIRDLLAAEQSTGMHQAFDNSAAQACLANVRGSVPVCAAIELEPCERIYVGTLATGQPCDSSDLSPANGCAPVSGAVVACAYGVCRAARRASQGEQCKRTCYASDQCTQVPGEPAFDPATAPSSWGDCYVDDGLACVGGSCIRAPALGSPCLAAQFCDKGAHCVGGTCEAFPSVGAACGVCAPDQYCSAGVCAQRSALGSSCAEDQACASGRCEANCASATAGQVHGSREECAGMVHL